MLRITLKKEKRKNYNGTMEKEEFTIKTKRLLLSPLSDRAMSRLVVETKDPSLRDKYSLIAEETDGMEENREWYTLWEIKDKATQNRIGIFAFEGAPLNQRVSLWIKTEEEYQDKGYTKEVISNIFDHVVYSGQGVYYLKISKKQEDITKEEMEELGFLDNGEYYEKKKSRVRMIPFTALLGIILGLVLSIFLKHVLFSIAIGAVTGALFGLVVDITASKREKETIVRE